MKAIEFTRPEVITMIDLPDPPAPGPGEALVRTHRMGICGTDLHIYNWDDWARKTVPVPLVVGHEFVGEIVEIGKDVVLCRVTRKQAALCSRPTNSRPWPFATLLLHVWTRAAQARPRG